MGTLLEIGRKKSLLRAQNRSRRKPLLYIDLRFRQKSRFSHRVIWLISYAEHHSDRLAGLFTLFPLRVTRKRTSHTMKLTQLL